MTRSDQSNNTHRAHGAHQAHHHHHGSTKITSSSRLGFSIVINLLIFIAQVIGGLMANSLALISDALHNFSDALAIAVSYIAERIGKKETDFKKTFGYQRAEILAALLNTSVLIIISFFLFKEAILRFSHPSVINETIVIIVAAFGLIANFVCAFLLHRFTFDNLNIRSAYLHLVTDVASSGAVIVGAIIIYYTEYYIIDSIISFALGLYILRGGYSILIETINILMQSTPEHIDILKIKSELESFPQISNVHHIHVWRLSDKTVLFEGHLDLSEDYKLSEIDNIRKHAEQLLWDKFQINHITLQTEYNCCDEKNVIYHRSNHATIDE